MIKVYYASVRTLQDPAIYAKKLTEVSETRLKKIEQCKMQMDKERSLMAGLLLNYAFQNYCKEQGKQRLECNIAYGENGKPFCMNEKGFYFNLSHSGEFVVCAIAEQEIGIDIQQIKSTNLTIAKRFFTEKEWLQLSALPKERQNQMFCKIWSGKESYVKYTGMGMRQAMNTFLIENETGHVYDSNHRKVACVYHSERLQGYEISVCIKEEKESPVYVQCPIIT